MARRASMSPSGSLALWLARQQDGDASEDQHDPDDREGVAEAQHEGLALDGITERNDRLLPCAGWVGHAVGREVIGHRGDPVAHLLAAEVDGLADDVGMKLLALGHDGGEHGGADGAAEVTRIMLEMPEAAAASCGAT